MTLHKFYIRVWRERGLFRSCQPKAGTGGVKRWGGRAGAGQREGRRSEGEDGKQRGKPGEDGKQRERIRGDGRGREKGAPGGRTRSCVLRRGCSVCKKGRSIVWSARRKKKGPSEGAFSRRRSGRPPGVRFGKSGIFSQNPPSGSCIRRGIYAIIRRIAERSDRDAAAMVRKGTFGGGAWSMPYPG